MTAFSTDHFRNGRFNFPESKRTLNGKEITKFINFSGSLDDDSYYLDTENRYYRLIMKEFNDRKSLYQLRKYRVRVKDPGVCPTLTANMGLGGHNVPFIHDSKGLRKLTEFECLKLQGFPKSFTFPEDVPRAKRYVQVGNSIAVPVASMISQKVKEKIEKEMI